MLGGKHNCLLKFAVRSENRYMAVAITSTKYNLSSIFKYDCILPNFTRRVMNQKMKRVNRASLLENQHVEILKPNYLFITSLFAKRRVWRQYDDSVHGDFWGETSNFHELTDPMPGGTQEIDIIQTVQIIPKKSNFKKKKHFYFRHMVELLLFCLYFNFSFSVNNDFNTFYGALAQT